ncbi:tetratricopeptide repeat protein [Nocardia sp. NPDC057663]|uniref:tetratricopeptide repeat protein n=1 Tax=Nocardia sp. NPDC057663 TaxID=3346201 RepID=UPI003670B24E
MAAALNWQGETVHACGDAAQAIRDHSPALELATETDNAPALASAHGGLARAHHLRGQLDRTRRQAALALNLFETLVREVQPSPEGTRGPTSCTRRPVPTTTTRHWPP